jgi:hypothetical protein
VSNMTRAYHLLCKLHVSLDIADAISRKMSDFTNTEQDIVYYWLQDYTSEEIQNLMNVTRYRVGETIRKFKALGRAGKCAVSGG